MSIILTPEQKYALFAVVDHYKAVEGDKVILTMNCKNCAKTMERSVLLKEFQHWLYTNEHPYSIFDIPHRFIDVFFINQLCPACERQKVDSE